MYGGMNTDKRWVIVEVYRTKSNGVACKLIGVAATPMRALEIQADKEAEPRLEATREFVMVGLDYPA